MPRKIRLKSASTDTPEDEYLEMNGNRSEYFRINFFELAALFLKKKTWIAGSVICAMILTGIIMFMTPNKYTSQARILPSGNSENLSALQQLAKVNGLTNMDENSSELFPVILRSRYVSSAVLGREYTYNEGPKKKTISLDRYFKTGDPSRLAGALAKVTAVSMDKKSGVIDVAVETKYPGLSQAIMQAYIEELENFNIHKRRSQAREAAKYLEKQLAENEKELRAAEDKLEEFQNVNRGWASTSNPEIIKMLTRFQRDIEVKSKTYLTLQQEYELAKLNAQKDIPVVRVLDQPSLPTVKSGPKRLSTIIFAGFAIFVTSLIVIVVLDALQKAGTGPDKESYEELKDDFSREFPKFNRIINRRRFRQESRSGSL